MTTKIYDSIPEEAKIIRTTVFIDEQGFSYDFDEIDSIAKHFVLYEDNRPIATCRVFQKENPKEYYIGRIAVIKLARGKGIGSFLLKEVEQHVKKLNGDRLLLHSQVRVKAFYQSCGFIEFGEIEDEDGCPHIWMEKKVL